MLSLRGSERDDVDQQRAPAHREHVALLRSDVGSDDCPGWAGGRLPDPGDPPAEPVGRVRWEGCESRPNALPRPRTRARFFGTDLPVLGLRLARGCLRLELVHVAAHFRFSCRAIHDHWSETLPSRIRHSDLPRRARRRRPDGRRLGLGLASKLAVGVIRPSPFRHRAAVEDPQVVCDRKRRRCCRVSQWSPAQRVFRSVGLLGSGDVVVSITKNRQRQRTADCRDASAATSVDRVERSPRQSSGPIGASTIRDSLRQCSSCGCGRHRPGASVASRSMVDDGSDRHRLVAGLYSEPGDARRGWLDRVLPPLELLRRGAFSGFPARRGAWISMLHPVRGRLAAAHFGH